MPTPPGNQWYHRRRELEKRVKKAGSWAALARESGVPSTTLKNSAQSFEPPVLSPNVTRVKVDAGVEELNLEHQLREARRRIRQLETGSVSDELFLRRLELAIAENRPRFEPVEFEPVKSERTEQEMVLLWSDLHAGEVVDLEATAGVNEYSWQIMLDRMADTQASVFSHAEHYGFNISRFVIAMLGDMLSGFIHDELTITNDRPVADALVDLAYDHAPLLTGYADYFGSVHCIGVPGNHPRMTQKPSYKEYYNNADWLFYKLLESILANDPRITFEIPRSAWAISTIADRWRVLLMHGDGIRSTMPGVPWGGVLRRITTIEAQMLKARTPLDFVFMGHFHSQNVLDGVNAQTFTNGSVKGPDEYSLAKFGSGQDASQTLLTFHPKRGWTGQYAVNLQGTMPASEGWS